jgi:RNA recognition motif-containing protein
VDVYIPTDRNTGRPRGFAFVEFASETEAAEAIERFNGQELGGRKLNVNAAEDRPQRSQGPRFAAAPPPFGFEGFGGKGRGFKNSGSRRGVRGKKRSLN